MNAGVQINNGHPLSRNLAGLYLLNERAGIRANDIANNKFGTLTNFSFSGTSNWTGNNYGSGAVSFDGTNDYITSGNVMNPTLSGFSIACSVNIRSFASFPIFVGKYNEGGSTGWLLNTSSTGVVQFILFGNTTGTIFIGRSTSATPIVINRWFNLTATYAPGGTTSANCRIYINGQRQDDTDLAGGVFTSPSASVADFMIGGAFIGGVPSAFYMTNGTISNVRIYNRELNSFEAQQLNQNPFIGLSNKIL